MYSLNEKQSSAGTSSVSRNAFEVLIHSQESLELEKQLPDAVEERNRKDKLYLYIIYTVYMTMNFWLSTWYLRGFL